MDQPLSIEGVKPGRQGERVEWECSAEGRPSDAELVRQTCAGQRSAFDELIERYQRRATSVAYRLLGDLHDALEVCQEAFVRAYQNLDSLEDQRRFGSWLLRIVTNLSLNFRRSRAAIARKAAFDDCLNDGETARDEQIGPGLLDEQPEARSAAAGCCWCSAIADLPDQQKTAWFCWYRALPQKEWPQSWLQRQSREMACVQARKDREVGPDSAGGRAEWTAWLLNNSLALVDDRENLNSATIDAAWRTTRLRRLVAEYESSIRSFEAPFSRSPSTARLQSGGSSEIAAFDTEPDTAAKLDRLLQTALPAVEPRVNWPRFARRVSQAIDQSAATRRVLRLSRWRAAALGGLAAAAALLLWFGLPPEQAPVAQPSAPPAGVVEQPLVATEQTLLPAAPEPSARPPKVTIALAEPHEMVAPPTKAAGALAGQRRAAMVRVHVHEEPGQPHFSRFRRSANIRTEVFFMLEPPDRTVLASAAGFGY